MEKVKDARATILKQLKQDAADGNITPLEHETAYQILVKAEPGHDMLFYANLMAKSHEKSEKLLERGNK